MLKPRGQNYGLIVEGLASFNTTEGMAGQQTKRKQKTRRLERTSEQRDISLTRTSILCTHAAVRYWSSKHQRHAVVVYVLVYIFLTVSATHARPIYL